MTSRLDFQIQKKAATRCGNAILAMRSHRITMNEHIYITPYLMFKVVQLVAGARLKHFQAVDTH